MALEIVRPTPPKVVVTNHPPREIELYYNRGESAYEVAQMNGYQGTEAEWLDSIDGTIAVQEHIADQTPHSVYDDMVNMNLIFENGLI